MSEGNQSYNLAELIAQCDPDSPMPPELLEWEQAEPVGSEHCVEDGQVDWPACTQPFNSS